jgi:hypothetical protein
VNADSEFRLLSRFTAWLRDRKITAPTDADVAIFMEDNR